MAICALADCRRLVWCLEQPTSSLLSNHNRMQDRFKCRPTGPALWVRNFSLVEFGAPTSKPIKVFSSRKWVFCVRGSTSPAQVRHRRQRRLTVRRWDSHRGKWAITGKGLELSASQAYPVAFGRAIARVFLERYRHKRPIKCNHCTRGLPRSLFQIVPEDSWSDAGVAAALLFLKRRA